MNYKEKYEKWLAYEALDADLRRELEEIAKDEQEIAERFTQELAFAPQAFGALSRQAVTA